MTFHRERLIYGIGVGILCTAQIAAISSWPASSNSLAPGKAEIFMATKVIGGTAMVWLFLGVRRIMLSPAARRDVLSWLLVFANIVAMLPLAAMGYD